MACPRCGIDQKKSPMIETERLLLRPFRMDDLDLIKALYCDAEVLRYSPFDTMSHEQTEEHLTRIVEDWEQDPLQSLEFVMEGKEDKEKIGRCHILIDFDTDTGMIGWFLRKEYWGQRYALESGQALIRYSFDILGLHRVNALCNPENLASRRILERCGLRQEAWFRQKCRYIKGGITTWEDEVEYAVLSSEWAVTSRASASG